MASTTLPEGTLGRVITRDNAQEGLYKYNIGERVVTVESKSNIAKGQLKAFPNHNIGVFKDGLSVVSGNQVAISRNIFDSFINCLNMRDDLSDKDNVAKSFGVVDSTVTFQKNTHVPHVVSRSYIYNSGYSGRTGFLTSTNNLQPDTANVEDSFIVGDFTLNGLTQISVDVSENVQGTPRDTFIGACYIGELNTSETIQTVIDRMGELNKKVHGAPYYYLGGAIFPENLPIILIATDKKVDLEGQQTVIFNNFVQIPDAIFQSKSDITDRWISLEYLPRDVTLLPDNIALITHSQLATKADSNGKVHLYGVVLNFTTYTNLVVRNYVQLVGENSYGTVAKSNTTRIGSPYTTDTYLRGTVHSNGSFVTDSDERIKRKDKLVTTRADGIEVWKFTYHSNGKTELGWIAQQVEEVLRAKSYEQDVIDLAITTASGVDYNASLSKLNVAMGSSYDLFSDAEKAHTEWLYGKFKSVGGKEPTLDAFREAIKKIPYESLTEWQKSTIQMLDENSLGSFLVWANDIKSINKQVVLDLLQGV